MSGTPAALETFATVDIGIDGNMVTHSKLFDLITHSNNGAGELMTHYQGENAAASTFFAMEQVQIRSTYTAGGDFYQNLVRTKRRLRNIAVFQIVNILQKKCFHSQLPPITILLQLGAGVDDVVQRLKGFLVGSVDESVEHALVQVEFHGNAVVLQLGGIH